MSRLVLIDPEGRILVEEDANNVQQQEDGIDTVTSITELDRVAAEEARKASTANKKEGQ